MNVFSVFDPEFAPYGRVLPDFPTEELLKVLEGISDCPENGTCYVASSPELEALDCFSRVSANVYGGLPVQIGYCNGTNHSMNALEYHRGCEVNVPVKEITLLLALQSDMAKDFSVDSSKVRAFRVPAGVPVLVYETSLHYAPIGDGFRVIVVLPKDTNTPLDGPTLVQTPEDALLWAKNKWLICHSESSEAKKGASVLITGENIRM